MYGSVQVRESAPCITLDSLYDLYVVICMCVCWVVREIDVVLMCALYADNFRV